jgi:predicted alpha/beta superfamily hydrolase
LWWDKESLFLQKAAILEKEFLQHVSVYIAVGKEGKVMEGDARRLSAALKKNNNPAVKVAFEYFEKEDHATIFHQAVYNGFKALSGK